jgi:release factor glutamine methyltransferase
LRLIKKIINHTYRPFLERYLSQDRVYNYNDLTLLIRQGVFHPGFFLSTKFLLNEVESLNLENKSLLELGCGSGLISVKAAQLGAKVTASDINPAALLCAEGNALKNGVSITTKLSDVFADFGSQQFDIIVVNPPYYRGELENIEAKAWYCGKDMEYFKAFLKQVGGHIDAQSLILMVLSEDCEVDKIKELAAYENMEMNLRKTKKNWLERNYIFEIKCNKTNNP